MGSFGARGGLAVPRLALVVAVHLWLPGWWAWPVSGLSWPKGLLGGQQDQVTPTELTPVLQTIDLQVLEGQAEGPWSEMLSRQLQRRVRAANQASSQVWLTINGRQAWENYVQMQRDRLRQSLGVLYSQTSPPLDVHVTGTISGDGFQILNVVFRSWGNLWITANFYRPEPLRPSMPAMVICHSHHTAKEHGELQDMGMTWARAGCLVLVMDQLGHGERRVHRFARPSDYARPFRVTRQDYYFRYDTAMQFHLAGGSLIGQIVWDLQRGMDFLLAQPGVDKNRLILLGSVAGGGDPTAVCTMLDERIACAVPFNFGGPQPETPYPLPDDAETSFNYAGSGSWESTRNLWCSARDGFLPWVVVAGVAPRRLIYAHEFSWDQHRDPVWKRFQKIYHWYDRSEHVAFTHGFGQLRGRPPEASHCTHIGREQRRMIHPAFARWFGLPEGDQHEYSNRLPADKLACWTDDQRRRLAPASLGEALDQACNAPPGGTSGQQEPFFSSVPPNSPPEDGQPVAERSAETPFPGFSLHRVVLRTEEGICVPVVLLVPHTSGERHPVVVLLARCGKQRIVRARATEVANLLRHSVAVCAVDVRGTGETAPDDALGRESRITALSATEMMFGRTLLQVRLKDLLATLAWLKQHPKLDASRIGLWGDSLAQPIQGDQSAEAPHGVDDRPPIAEPLGGLLALMAAATDHQVAAVYVRGGLVSYRSAFGSFCVHIPHEDVVVGAVPAGDIVSIVRRLQIRPVRFHRLVDAQNRLVSASTVLAMYQSDTGQAMENLSVSTAETDSAATWFLRCFGRLPR